MKLATIPLFLLLLCAPLRADIEVPDTVAVHEPVVATVKPTGVPEGAKIRGSFSVSSGKSIPCGEAYHLWLPPGKHTLKASGVWVLTQDLTVDGQTFPIMIDFGAYSFEKTITVGEAPGPDPPGPDPPNPVGPKQIMIFYEGDRLDNYPPPQREILVSLALRQELVQAGHVVLEMVESAALSGTAPARYKTFFDAARGQALPVLTFAPKAGGTVKAVPLPADKTGLLEALK